ncbi:MAG TPA: alanine racemase [Ignavibacteriaceae bacterium]|nr:alanine racemase [Ignavibacteriaceae bacterium]
MVRHSSYIELSQSSLKKNINFIRKKIGSHPKISAVVKANAYGHGIPQIVQMLEKCGVDYFAVASASEAEEVFQNCSEKSRIMIMGILYDTDIEWAIENGIEFYVFDYNRFQIVKEKSKKIGKPAIVHIEVETGTNRTGMNWRDFKKAITFLKKNKELFTFQGVCTHLGGIENINNQFRIKPQIQKFNEAIKELRKKKFMPTYRHMACSAAALAYPETHYDLVRTGVVIYGFWPSPDTYHLHLQDSGKLKDSPLKRIISWKTNVMDIKDVKEGEFIGYGTAYQAYRNLRIAVIPVGYSNGYPRGLSGKGYVLLKGKKAPITGLINMNLFMIDITHIKDVQIGSEVVLLGKQGNNVISVSSFTNFTNLLNNEMLSRLPAAIPRKIVS